MKCYKVTYWKIGDFEERKICTSLWTAFKLCFKVRHCIEWSIGVTHINTLRNLVTAKEIQEFLNS